MEEVVRLLLEQMNPWHEKGPHNETWTECQFCDETPKRDVHSGKYNLGHSNDCKYRIACELLSVEMRSGY